MEQPPIPVLDPAGRDLYSEAATLRAQGPAVRVMLPGDIPAWYITRHEILKSLLTDDRVSKDPRRHWPVFQRGEITPESWLNSWIGVVNMLTAYGPDHRRLRKLIAPAFTARRTEALAPRIREIADGLLDAMAEAPADRWVDLRSAYAHPLPMAVICELFGVPQDMRARTAKLIEGIMDTTATPEEAAATWQEIPALLGGLIALKRAEPGDDMTTVLIDARDEDGSRLSEEELLYTLLLVIGAGFETTVNLIGNATHALLSNPAQLELVRAGKADWNDVIEETLRFAPSIANLPLRFTVEDIEIPGGPVIPKGEAILTSYGAAGHDPSQHGADAGSFDVSRAASDHLAFGHGVHHCLGAPLARLEARIALPALFERFPDLALTDMARTPEQVESFIADGLARLPVQLGSSA